MAYLYFNFSDLLPSLLIQLSARSDARCDYSPKSIRNMIVGTSGVQEPSNCAMSECLKQMLALEGQGPTYIILDALDLV